MPYIDLATAVQELVGFAGKRQGKAIRFGSHGSLSFVVDGAKAGLWYDHESGEGGDLVTYLIQRKGFDVKSAFEYLEQRGLREEFHPDKMKAKAQARPTLDADDLSKAKTIAQRRSRLDAILPDNVAPMNVNAIKYAEQEWFEHTGETWTTEARAHELISDCSEHAERNTAALLFPIQDASDYLTPLAPPNWIIPGFIEEQQVGWMYGATGSFKTLLAIHVSVATSQGTKWFGRPVTRRRVLYCFAEGQSGIKRRLQAYIARHKIKFDPSTLFFLEVPLRVMEGEERVDAFIQATVEQIPGGIDVLILDTYNAHRGAGEENSNDDAARYHGLMLIIRSELHCAIITVHHTGKDHERGMRGASAMLADADFAIELSRTSPDAETCVARTVKAKEVEAGTRHYFRSDKVELQTTEGATLVSFALTESDETELVDERLDGEKGNLNNQGRGLLLLEQMCLEAKGPAEVDAWLARCVEADLVSHRNKRRFASTKFFSDHVVFEVGRAFPTDFGDASLGGFE